MQFRLRTHPVAGEKREGDPNGAGTQRKSAMTRKIDNEKERKIVDIVVQNGKGHPKLR